MGDGTRISTRRSRCRKSRKERQFRADRLAHLRAGLERRSLAGRAACKTVPMPAGPDDSRLARFDAEPRLGAIHAGGRRARSDQSGAGTGRPGARRDRAAATPRSPRTSPRPVRGRWRRARLCGWSSSLSRAAPPARPRRRRWRRTVLLAGLVLVFGAVAGGFFAERPAASPETTLEIRSGAPTGDSFRSGEAARAEIGELIRRRAAAALRKSSDERRLSRVHDRTAGTASSARHVGCECPRSCGPGRPSRRDARLAAAGGLGSGGRAALSRGARAKLGRLSRPGIELPRRFAAAVHRVSLHDRQLRPERPPLHRRADVRRDRGLHLSGRQITAWRTSPTRRCRARRGRCSPAPVRRPRSGRRPDA